MNDDACDTVPMCWKLVTIFGFQKLDTRTKYAILLTVLAFN